MAIKSIKKLNRGKMKIDLTGPHGNAFVLLGYARQLSDKFGKNTGDILSRMQSSDYENLIKVFDAEFGDYVVLYR